MQIELVSEAPLARVATVEVSDFVWGYENTQPTWKEQPALDGNYGRQNTVDPWGPCYSHDADLVTELLVECVEAAPLGSAPVTVYLLPYEDSRRCNAWAHEDVAHYGDPLESWRGPGLKPWEGAIALSGKRTEIHPAITRYLVGHEYGHIVEDALARIRYGHGVGGDDGRAGPLLIAEYAKLRGLRTDLRYGSGTHHLIPGEVFANDFRGYVLGREQEFWPHPVKPAWKLKRVARWWDKAIDELRDAAGSTSI